MRENQILIHLSERFWTLGSICTSDQNSGEVSEVFPSSNNDVGEFYADEKNYMFIREIMADPFLSIFMAHGREKKQEKYGKSKNCHVVCGAFTTNIEVCRWWRASHLLWDVVLFWSLERVSGMSWLGIWRTVERTSWIRGWILSNLGRVMQIGCPIAEGHPDGCEACPNP